MRITVGSTAAKELISWRDSNDIDIITDELAFIGDYNGRGGYDIHYMPTDILMMFSSDSATLDELYTLKLSHLGWDNHHWEKHKLDAIALTQNGAKLLPDLYNRLVSHWREVLGNKEYLSLNKTNDEFFDDHVTYIYDHDFLHSVVSGDQAPVYTTVLQDGHDVMIDRRKFEKLPHTMKVRMFREEIATIALERWCIPTSNRISWYKAHIYSLRKTITTLTKGWATDFILLNMTDFIEPDINYYMNAIHKIKELQHMTADLSIFNYILEQDIEYSSLDDLIYVMCEDEVYGAKALAILNGLGYRHLDQDGGGEGGSEYCYGVFELDGVIYRAEYRYYSYNGHEYSGIANTLRVVKETQKTITVYE